ncbi:MAG: hypothetical protein AUG49_23335 [Catenulispora sp. 13_1_20CM_3_70_7]|nr:MAG: hypothetical protein AUG49_23335 [Catenulispora sp. 13_1_20CM_3_70_7]
MVDWVCALVAAWLMVPRVDDWPALELVPAVWVAVTCWHRLYERRHVGPGSEEYHRLLRSCLAAMAVLAAPCALLIDNDDLVRGVLLAVPATAVGSLVARRALRRMQAAVTARGCERSPRWRSPEPTAATSFPSPLRRSGTAGTAGTARTVAMAATACTACRPSAT